MEKDFICIVCPKGCHIHVKDEEISGYSCPRGLAYVKQELTNPTRMITSTIKIEGKNAVCPVKTSKPISKDLIFKVMEEINKVSLPLPIHYHQIIIKNVLGTDVDIIATKEFL